MRASTGTPLDRKGYDRTGVGTLRCPHSLALALVDVRAGERFSLSHASVAHLRRQGAQLERLIYDVGDARFKASSDHPDRLALLLGELLCSAPAMHMRVHDLVCQILYRVTTVCGLGRARWMAASSSRMLRASWSTLTQTSAPWPRTGCSCHWPSWTGSTPSAKTLAVTGCVCTLSPPTGAAATGMLRCHMTQVARRAQSSGAYAPSEAAAQRHPVVHPLLSGAQRRLSPTDGTMTHAAKADAAAARARRATVTSLRRHAPCRSRHLSARVTPGAAQGATARHLPGARRLVFIWGGMPSPSHHHPTAR